ncbi:S-layer family protein [Waterburya agarophytonicola K14]|uniref:S-layer family protein n=1 Tax=Waterburya agarophytonicola KI4 TaxID=2874699 RepID=A0A964BS61_9CYAN|nr:S-layer family protein [Waterburya agarophytonicola]MCC0178743.1 S-layer family protein [Waterburya agarophytonicola KI4]
MKKALFFPLQVGLCTLGCFYSNSTQAQVTSDGTVNTQINTNGNVAEITGGEIREGNLFHSFQDFSVPTGNEAFFNNANDISNIFSRVTGGNISNIDGTIRANGSASLFLINPAGIIFGENARLDIGGSFYGSSASSILFEDGEFSAADLENPPLLTVNAPIGLGFRDNPGDIVSRANFGLTEQTFEQEIDGESVTVNRVTDVKGLEVNRGQSIALIGGDIFLEGGGVTAPGGNVTLGGLSQAGQINFDADGGFDFPNLAKADLSLTNSALVSVVSDGGGFINVDVSNLTISEESQLLAGIGEGLGNSSTTAGDIVINSSESVRLIGDGQFEDPEIDLDAGIRNLVGLSIARQNNSDEASTAVGNSGSIFINTDLLEVTERADINVRIYGTGNAGDVNISANEVLMNEGGITSQVREGGQGNSGSVNINTNLLNASNLSFIITDHLGEGQGNSGDINITATESFVFEDNIFSALLSSVGEDVIGNAGDINITAGSLTFDNNVQLLAQAQGQGNAGNVNLTAINDIDIINGADIIAQVLEGVEGNSGDINITTDSLQIDGGSSILADTRGSGDAGNIIIQATEEITLDGESTLILTEVGDNAEGNAGNIDLTSNSLVVQNSAEIISQTKGIGNAGDITINANENVLLQNDGEIIAQVTNNALGNSGTVNINTSNLTILQNSRLSVDSQGQGNAGNIIVNTNDIELENNGFITASTVNGQGGNIQLNVDDILTMRNNSLISAQAQGTANGGNVTINSNFVIVFPDGNNDILANAAQGNGGDIDITTNSLFGIEERPLNESTNDINASSEFSLDGTISISTPDINLIQGAIDLPTNVVEAEQTIQQACEANREIAAKNSLNINGKGGIVPDPALPLNSLNVIANGENATTSTIPAPIETSQGKIQPARGVKITESGEVILTAYRTNNSGDRLTDGSRNCI